MIQLISDLKPKGYTRAEIDAGIAKIGGSQIVDSQPLSTSTQQVIDAITAARQPAEQPSSNQVSVRRLMQICVDIAARKQVTSNTRKQPPVLTSHTCLCNCICLCFLITAQDEVAALKEKLAAAELETLRAKLTAAELGKKQAEERSAEVERRHREAEQRWERGMRA